MADPTDREDEIERRVSRLFPQNPDCEHSADILEVCVDCVASALRDVAREAAEIADAEANVEIADAEANSWVGDTHSDRHNRCTAHVVAAAIRKRFGVGK